MITTIGHVLATSIAAALLIGVFVGAAPIGVGQLLMVLLGWTLAYFGDEVAPLIGVTSTSSSAQYVEPVIRAIGWLLLLVALGLDIARMARIW